jgi:hypothetical protein
MDRAYLLLSARLGSGRRGSEIVITSVARDLLFGRSTESRFLAPKQALVMTNREVREFPTQAKEAWVGHPTPRHPAKSLLNKKPQGEQPGWHRGVILAACL